MPFVKLDTGILTSTLWIDKPLRDVFITALLLAIPRETTEPMEQLAIGKFEKTGFVVPPGWYGFVPAASVGIIRLADVDQTVGLDALERLGAPDLDSRSGEFEGRRLVRVDGGFLILNFMKYRDRDYSGADRAKAYRQRQKSKPSRVTAVTSRVTSRQRTQAEVRGQRSETDSKMVSSEKIETGGKVVRETAPLGFSADSLARPLSEKLNLPVSKSNLMILSESIKAVARQIGKPENEAFDFLLARAQADAAAGVKINKFYFEDAKYNEGPATSRKDRETQEFLRRHS